MKLITFYFVLFLIIIMAGCATLNPKAKSVMIVTNQLDYTEYEYLGDITVTSDHFLGQGKSVESARIKLRNKASAMGADIVTIDTNNQYNEKVTLSGRAFKKKSK